MVLGDAGQCWPLSYIYLKVPSPAMHRGGGRVEGGLRYIILCINERVTTRQKILTLVVMLRCNQHEFLKAHVMLVLKFCHIYIVVSELESQALCST